MDYEINRLKDKRAGTYFFNVDGKECSGTIEAMKNIGCSMHKLRRLMINNEPFEYEGKKISFDWVKKETKEGSSWPKRKEIRDRNKEIDVITEYSDKAELIKKLNVRENKRLIAIKPYFKFYKGLFLEFNYKNVLQKTYSKESFIKSHPSEYVKIREELKSFKHSLINKPYLGANPFNYEDHRSN